CTGPRTWCSLPSTASPYSPKAPPPAPASWFTGPGPEGSGNPGTTDAGTQKGAVPPSTGSVTPCRWHRALRGGTHRSPRSPAEGGLWLLQQFRPLGDDLGGDHRDLVLGVGGRDVDEHRLAVGDLDALLGFLCVDD